MKPEFEIYYVVEGNKKTVWKKCGAMWKNKAGGHNLEIEALPVPFVGKLVSFPTDPEEKPEVQQ